MRRPLEGIKVLDLSTMLAASSCSRIFAEWGADVIKVEAPAGDIFRGTLKTMGGPIYKEGGAPIYDVDNANKTFIALDLKNPKGMEILMRLLESADILVTNYREKALKKLGIDYESLKERFPRLIYSWTGGYGTKGPDKDKGAFDYTTFYARTGIMTGLNEKGSPPINSVSGFGDHTAGLCQALATMTALYARTVTGKGDRIETSLYQAGLYVTNNGPLMAAGGREWPRSRRTPNQITSTTYQCRDGIWFHLAATKYNDLWPIICKNVIFRPDLLEDPRFDTRDHMLEHTTEGVGILEEVFAQEDYEHWAKLLKENDIPFEKCFHFSEVLSDEQALANEYFTEYTYPGGQKIGLIRAPAKFDSCPELIELHHAKGVGEDTRGVLKELGYTDTQVDELNREGAIKA